MYVKMSTSPGAGDHSSNKGVISRASGDIMGQHMVCVCVSVPHPPTQRIKQGRGVRASAGSPDFSLTAFKGGVAQNGRKRC